MGKLRITTWNANSIRLRAAYLERIVAEIRPDVLCLQEIKVEDDLFPVELCRSIGFEHVHVHGQKAYHGVAVLSKVPLDACHTRRWCGIEDSRHAICTLPGGIELHNFYIPAGGDVPDPEVNREVQAQARHAGRAHGLFRRAARRRRADGPGGRPQHRTLGDRRLEPPAAAGRGLAHAGRDRGAAARCRRPTASSTRCGRWCRRSEKLFTWWSYRNRDWEASDRGRRLDHIWLSPALAPSLVTAEVTQRRARLGQPERSRAGDGRARGLSHGRPPALPPLAVTMGEPAGIGGEILLAAWRRLAATGPVFLAIDDPARLRALAGDTPIRTVADPAEAAGVFRHALPVLALGQRVGGRAGPAGPTARGGGHRQHRAGRDA